MESLAQLGVEIIRDGFLDYRRRFQQITGRAQARFEDCDWPGAHADAVERLHLYPQVVGEVLERWRAAAGEQAQSRPLWRAMKPLYAAWILTCGDFELAETFFNSITRRVFVTVGVNAEIEFVGRDFEPPAEGLSVIQRHYPVQGNLAAVLQAILTEVGLAVPYRDLAHSAGLAAQQICGGLEARCQVCDPSEVELLAPVFYRGQGAYLVGRVLSANGSMPLALALLHTPQGLALDAVLTTDDQISILFSFTRSYFHVAVERPYELVHFLKEIMPWKRTAELYISIGFNKHGKTEFYRDLQRHLAQSSDQFVVAPGQRGMVMAVFTLPSYDIVFKLIKDKFADPKLTTRAEVMQHYDLVFLHDRAGRLVDAQEFEHLSFERSRFDPALLQELLEEAPSCVQLTSGPEGERVVVHHLYLERRLTPLDIFVRQAAPEATEAAIIDYGQTIKDLAATNIFPGDVLLKNFGVTRHGRVVFYDYDELCLVTDCRFRKLPEARTQDDETAAEPWFYVGRNDIFPQEFETFLGLTGRLREVFTQHHGELFTSAYWRAIQKRHQAGEIMDILPYRTAERLAVVE